MQLMPSMHYGYGHGNDFLTGDVDMPHTKKITNKKNYHNNETNNTMQKQKSSSGGVGRELPSWGL